MGERGGGDLEKGSARQVHAGKVEYTSCTPRGVVGVGSDHIGEASMNTKS